LPDIRVRKLYPFNIEKRLPSCAGGVISLIFCRYFRLFRPVAAGQMFGEDSFGKIIRFSAENNFIPQKKPPEL